MLLPYLHKTYWINAQNTNIYNRTMYKRMCDAIAETCKFPPGPLGAHLAFGWDF